MSTYGERLRRALHIRDMDQAELARRVGVKQQAISYLCSDRAQGSKYTIQIAYELSIHAYWLAKGRGAMELRHPSRHLVTPMINDPANTYSAERTGAGHYTFIPRYQLGAGAGNGRYADHELVEDHLAFRTDWLKSRAYAIEDLIVIHAEGESMEPMIRDGNVILVDCAQRRIKSGRIYALRIGEDVRIKRLFWQTDGSLLISSDNKSADHRDEIVLPHAIENVHIIGRAVWTGGEI